MADLSPTQIRAASLEAASRAVAEGSPPGYYLSTARQFETYIRSGLSQVGPRFKQGILCGSEGIVLRIDGDLSEAEAAEIEAAITHLLTKDA